VRRCTHALSGAVDEAGTDSKKWASHLGQKSRSSGHRVESILHCDTLWPALETGTTTLHGGHRRKPGRGPEPLKGEFRAKAAGGIGEKKIKSRLRVKRRAGFFLKVRYFICAKK